MMCRFLIGHPHNNYMTYPIELMDVNHFSSTYKRSNIWFMDFLFIYVIMF